MKVILSRVARHQPRVFYGFKDIPGPDQPAHGGVVKFQRMQRPYPNTPDQFNVLYMVSSFAPSEAGVLAWASRMKGIPVLWNQNGVAYPGWKRDRWKEANAQMRSVLSRANHVLYQSDFCKRAADEFIGKCQCPSEVLYNSVDTRVFVPNEKSLNATPLILLLAGNQYQWNRFKTAIDCLREVLKELPDAELHVTGQLNWADGNVPHKDAEEYMVKVGVRDHVKLLGPYVQQDAVKVFQAAHVLLHTKYNDPCPGVVVEAMACGLPVVYSNTGGTGELVGDKAGVGVDSQASWEKEYPPSAEALAMGVIKVFQNLPTYSLAARTRAVDYFDIEPWLARHAVIFQSFLKT
ncbi:MAG: glycosyltransferase family 4 protein [Verrucomicrobiota bacterium]|nr:glycosyltransferase family 4 protein [Verrucomicrobiota bacterium]